MATRNVRFGVLGAGRIARNAFAPALTEARGAELAAWASRDVLRAQALHPPRAYGSYDALLDDETVEAVYIATHNGLHRSLAVKALEKGKHVLCEKPLAPTASEAATMAVAARQHDRLLMEGFMYRYHPQMSKVRELLDAGAIGDLRTVEAAFSFALQDESDVRCNPAWGGGSLLDVGCYCVNACRTFFEAEPVAVTALGKWHTRYGVDWAVHGVLDFGDGRFGTISCGFDGGPRNHVILSGTKGTITLPQAFANSGKATKVVIAAGGKREEIRFEPTNVYRLEIEDFARAVTSGAAPLLSLDEGVNNARVLDAVVMYVVS